MDDARPDSPSVDLLARVRSALGGDRGDLLDRLLPQAYDDLRRLARFQRRGARDDTLGTTALVHEAYLKLSASASLAFTDREHFLALAARTMRQILVDHSRRVVAAKRGGAAAHVPIEHIDVAHVERARELITLDAALEQLALVDAPLSRLVELRFFAGLSIDDTAGVLGTSASTVKREWRKARAFLLAEVLRDAS